MRPRRQEVWLVAFEPQIGAEIQKTRPAVIISAAAIENLPVLLVVPFRDRKSHHSNAPFLTAIQPTPQNGLDKDSSADCAQVKSFARERFVKKLGILTDDDFQQVIDGVALCIGA